MLVAKTFNLIGQNKVNLTQGLKHLFKISFDKTKRKQNIIKVMFDLSKSL